MRFPAVFIVVPALLTAPAAAAEGATESPYSVTLAVHGNLVLDATLALEFRVDEHFAWGFEIGAAFEGDDVGVTIGADLKYFVDDFEGFYLGFGAASAGIKDEGEITTRSLLRGFFGHKWIVGGFTFDLNAGPTLSIDEDALPGGAIVRELNGWLNVQAALGWSF